MNILDLLMLLGFVVGVAIGFLRGLVQQAMGLLSIYISVVVAVWAHRLFGNLFKALLPSLSRPASNMLGFLTVLLIIINVLGLITRDIEKNARWVKKVPPLLNQTGGLALGFATSAFWLGLAGTALVVISQVPWLGAEEAHDSVVTLLQNSFMVYVFRYAFHLGLYTITPWVPGGLPEILTAPL